MISNISQNTTVISVSVGQDVRVRDSQQPGNVASTRATAEKDAGQKAITKLENPQHSKPGSEEIEKILIQLQKKFQHVAPRIELSVDKELGQIIFRLFDKESGELIRQVPSEEALKLDRFFADQSGLFVEEEI